MRNLGAAARNGTFKTAAEQLQKSPLPLAPYAAECSYRKAILEALKQSGRQWRVVLESPSSRAVKACVEPGLAICLLVTERMRILDGLPSIPV